MSTDISDFIGNGLSSCCGAKMYDPGDTGIGLCGDCRDWCGVAEEE